MIEASGITKTFGSIRALDGVSLKVADGELLGLLGPNGAGKTTFINVLCTLVRPDSGSAIVGGHDVLRHPEKVRPLLGVVPQEISLYPEMTALENLSFFGGLYGVRGKRLSEKTEWALDLVGLTNRAHDKVKTYSGGMKRRVNLASSILHDPQILLFDEPTVGVDPQSRNLIFEVIEEFARSGKTIIYTTHYMEEAERLCNRVAIIDEGKVVGLGTNQELQELVGETDLIAIDFTGSPETAVEAANRHLGAECAHIFSGELHIRCRDGTSALPGLLQALSESGITITSVSVTRPNLETVFLHLTGKQLRDR